jgi:hypothetical protein
MTAMHKLPYPLDSYGRKDSSQNDEDGIIEAILAHIPVARYFVEFGCDPTECNCLKLHRLGWPGLFMDAAGDKSGGTLIKKEWVSAANIEELLDKYKVPEFGVLSIDIDGQDYWVWDAIQDNPTLVVIEYNGKLGINQSLVIPRDDNFMIQSQFYGASLLAMNRLARRKGYQLVYANGVNAFFVDRYKLANADDFQYEKIYRAWPTETIQDPRALGFVAADSLGRLK